LCHQCINVNETFEKIFTIVNFIKLSYSLFIFMWKSYNNNILFHNIFNKILFQSNNKKGHIKKKCISNNIPWSTVWIQSSIYQESIPIYEEM